MHKRKFFITLAVIIVVAIIILLMSIALKWVRKWGGYIEDVGYLRGDLVKSLNNYYNQNGRYPEEFNHLPMYSYYREHGSYPEDFRVRDLGLEILTDVNYTSDGNSFELVWKYPSYPDGDTNYMSIVTFCGLKGEVTHNQTVYKDNK